MKQKSSVRELIKEVFYKASLIVTLGMFLYVFFCAATAFGSMPFLNGNLNPFQKAVFMITGVLLFGGTFLCVMKITKKWNNKKCTGCIFGLFAVMFLLQLVFLFHMKINLRYDALKVLDEAISVCKTGMVSKEHLDGYFAQYTNNYPILFVTVLILKFGRFCGFLNENYAGASMLVGVINILAIDIAVFFTVRLSAVLLGVKKALLCMAFIFLNPLVYIWVPFYYTNTMAMPFVAAVLYLSYCLFVAKNSKNQGIKAVLLGICMIVGIKIRATTMITVMACILFFFLCKKHENLIKENKKEIFKTALYRGSLILAGMLLAFGAFRAAEKKWISFDYTDTEFPAIHWISMGAAGTGEYSIVDEQNTMSFATKEEKSEANWELYKKRVKELGVTGYISHMFGKLKTTFADAGAGYHSELGVSDLYEDSNLYLVGGKSDFIGFLIQVNYVVGIIFSIIAIWMYLIKKKKDYFYVVFLNLAGGFLFHMIWEAGNIYSLSFVLLWPLGMVAGVSETESMLLFGADKANCHRKLWQKIGIVTFLLTFLCSSFVWKKMTNENYVTNDAVVNQYIYEWGDTDELGYGKEIVQSFYGNRAFNRLSFQVRNVLLEQNNSSYCIELLDENYDCVESFQVNARDYGDYDFIRLTCRGKENDRSSSKYYVRIRKTGGDDACNLVFLSYKTGNFDAYSYGEYEDLGETNISNKDLCFSVYETKEEPYAGKAAFVMVLVTILLYEAVIQIYLCRCPKEGPAQ